MSSQSAFDYARPFDIMVGHWVGTANIYGPHGVYLMSTKSYVTVYWKERYKILSFWESAEEDPEFGGAAKDYVDSRQSDSTYQNTIAQLLKTNPPLLASNALRVLAYELNVDDRYCEGSSGHVSVNGRQTRPDVYQFHVKKIEESGDAHHVYNSHHLPSPDDWHIIGPIVGPIDGEEGEVGVAVVQNFRRISYDVPAASVRNIV